MPGSMLRCLLLVGVVAAALALGGCQSLRSSLTSPTTAAPPVASSTPQPSPTTSTTTTRTPSQPPPVPAAAKQKTKAGAVAFTQFFWQQFNRGQTEPNPLLVQPLSLDSCVPCAAYTDGAQRLVENGQRYAAPPFVVKGVQADTLDGTSATVLSTVDQQAARVVDGRGTAVATATARQPRFLVTLAWDAGWKVSDIQVVT